MKIANPVELVMALGIILPIGFLVLMLILAYQAGLKRGRREGTLAPSVKTRS